MRATDAAANASVDADTPLTPPRAGGLAMLGGDAAACEGDACVIPATQPGASE
ncbi:hypothetical protein OSC27_08540 [Microbacterium sp. STN6]|uniref:hypothetical protein n=1 Tax=Microbacterium sp. STN6 TaxID=2995588 RepID=UPI002260C22A|nr:hypothetical protein [Microbacterium sp. STN6]MCX7522325.1 hypothetical protein [Microbacterium sp. STN6]